MSAKLKKTLSRRNLFRTSVGATGVLVAGSTLANVCGVSTGDQPLGPFFPRPGTPEDPIRENKDPNVPIYLANDNDLTYVRGRLGKAKGQVVYIRGVVRDESCKTIKDANIIIWQASSTGRYNHTGDGSNHDFRHPKTGKLIKRSLDPSFQFWGRARTNDQGEYLFKTIVPGFYPADLQGGWYRPPHIHFMISATGFPQLVTQMYFKGNKIIGNQYNQQLNKVDSLLQSDRITDEQRKELLVEFKEDNQFSDGLLGQFDITMTL